MKKHGRDPMLGSNPRSLGCEADSLTITTPFPLTGLITTNIEINIICHKKSTVMLS